MFVGKRGRSGAPAEGVERGQKFVCSLRRRDVLMALPKSDFVESVF